MITYLTSVVLATAMRQLESLHINQLNVPKWQAYLKDNSTTHPLHSPWDLQTFTRTVTYVGKANSSYVVMVVPPPGTYVTGKPSTLHFSELNQKITYLVGFIRYGSAYKSGEYTHRYLKWVSGKYSVRIQFLSCSSDKFLFMQTGQDIGCMVVLSQFPTAECFS